MASRAILRLAGSNAHYKLYEISLASYFYGDVALIPGTIRRQCGDRVGEWFSIRVTRRLPLPGTRLLIPHAIVSQLNFVIGECTRNTASNRMNDRVSEFVRLQINFIFMYRALLMVN